MKRTLKYPNGTETLIIEISLKPKDNNLEQLVFTASGSLYKGVGRLGERNLISAGQCLGCIPEFAKTMDNKYKNKKVKKRLLEIYVLWKKWHLNDMGTWCKHMNYGNFPKTEIKMHKLVGNKEYEKLSKIRNLPPKYITVSEQGLANIPRALYDYASYDVKHNKHIETKPAGWVTYDPVLSPEGLIGKECPVCGAKYGHSWYYRPIPTNILKRIKRIIGGYCNNGNTRVKRA